MNHEDGNNLVESPGNLGIDPQTAAHDIREILAASGKSPGILAQRRALLDWADKVRRRFSESFWIDEARVGGLEHLVWHDTEFHLVRKATHGGSFGRTVRSLDRGLVPATPLEYLDRWALHNQMFAPITKVSGILEKAGGELSILIQQEPLVGDLPNEKQIADFMEHFGFTPLPGKRFAWMARASQTVVFDARPANFVLIDRTPIPFDLITLPASQVLGLPGSN